MKTAMKSVTDFDEAISMLDSLIASGWAKYKLAERAFHKAIEETVLSHEAAAKLLKVHRGTHNMWFEEVRHNIELLTDRNYYWVLIINAPRNDGKMISGLGLDISSYLICFENELKVLSDILIMLEERRGTVIRQEIAKQERDASMLYEITCVGREIKINDIQLSKPDFMSENELFFSYIFERPWQKIKIDDMLADLKMTKFKKSVSQMLSDLRFTGNVRKIFCPDASSNGIEFRNPITRGYADENHLPTLNLADSRNNKK